MLTEEKSVKEMSEAMMENSMPKEVSEKKETKECAIIGLIKNQRIVLEEELDDAYREYGFISKKAKFSSKYYKAEHRCNILEAKLEVVEQMEAYIMEMMKLPMAS